MRLPTSKLIVHVFQCKVTFKVDIMLLKNHSVS